MPDRAHDALDGLPASDQADTAFGYTQRQPFIPKATRCSRWVTPSGQARAFGKALRRYQPGEFLDRSLIVLGRARCPAVREYREALLTG